MRGAILAAVMTAAAIGGGLAASVPAWARHPGAPDPGDCPALPDEEPLNDRTRPLPVPPQFAMILASNRERYALATIYGGTICVDTRPMSRVGGFTVSEDRRFLEFDWTGYEAGGHVVVDRTGRGQVIETGVSPVSSPSRRRFAAVQQSEAAFGALEGFGIWQVNVVGLTRLTLRQDIPSLADWRIDGWGGDDCVALSGISHDRFAGPRSRRAKLPRDRYVALREGQGHGQSWALKQSADGCPKSPK